MPIAKLPTPHPPGEWRKRYAVRSGIEGTVCEFAHGHGIRHCRYRDNPKARLQHVLTAIAVNIDPSASAGCNASRLPGGASPSASYDADPIFERHRIEIDRRRVYSPGLVDGYMPVTFDAGYCQPAAMNTLIPR
jgi:Transposase DDE domain